MGKAKIIKRRLTFVQFWIHPSFDYELSLQFAQLKIDDVIDKVPHGVHLRRDAVSDFGKNCDGISMLGTHFADADYLTKSLRNKCQRS